MQERLGHILFDEGLVKKTDRILCAVSGGADSMVMSYLLTQIGLEITVAHCNFQLRGVESDGDAAFVAQFCSDNNIPYISKTFNTKSFCMENKMSIQEGARYLRYEWFETERTRLGYNWTFTAHNLSDNAETMLINQLRGTGLKGLMGIPMQRDSIIRPMILFTAKEIRDFAKQHEIKFRNDSSNDSDTYLRNTIRHNVAPELSKISADFEQTFLKNGKRIRESAELIDVFIARFKSQHVKHTSDGIYLPKDELNSFPHPHIILSKLVSNANFDIGQIKQLLLSNEVGKRIESQTHTMFLDRDSYILTKNDSNYTDNLQITQLGQYQFGGFTLTLTQTEFQQVQFPLVKNEIIITQSELDKTINVRSWNQKDVLRPFGLKGNKLVSDVLIDNKVSSAMKRNIPILWIQDKILWVAGLCFSEHFRINKHTISPSEIVIRIRVTNEQLLFQ